MPRNPRPYEGTYAIRDTGTAVRWLRNMGVAVLGVFAGEERELEAEKKIFGKDFCLYPTDFKLFCGGGKIFDETVGRLGLKGFWAGGKILKYCENVKNITFSLFFSVKIY